MLSQADQRDLGPGWPFLRGARVSRLQAGLLPLRPGGLDVSPVQRVSAEERINPGVVATETSSAWRPSSSTMPVVVAGAISELLRAHSGGAPTRGRCGAGEREDLNRIACRAETRQSNRCDATVFYHRVGR